MIFVHIANITIFQPRRMSQKSMSSTDLLNSDKLGMGVWGSVNNPSEDNMTRRFEDKTTFGIDTDSKLDEILNSIERSRSISLQLEMSLKRNPSDNLHVSELLTYPVVSREEKKEGSSDKNEQISSLKYIDSCEDISYEQKAHYVAQYLPPTWDPQTNFCFPVAELPVVHLIPDNLEIRHFTDIRHIADGSNANVFLADLNEEAVIIKMIREQVST